jgi:DNA-binding transcriptional LysR family regulator
MRFMTNLRFIDTVARERSIRKAADKLAITSTALNRRILQVEDEIGQPLFERLPSGVRLNTAGEIFVQHIRSQMADLARVQSQIADLSGIRRGHIRIASGADALRYFLPEMVATYRRDHPAVTFELTRCHGDIGEASLLSMDTDIALNFAPVKASHFQVMATVKQQIYCLMNEGHPLAKRDVIRLRDCIGHPAILPSTQSGIRQLVDSALIRRNLELSTFLESDSFEFMQNYLLYEEALSFQIPIGLTTTADGTVASGVAGIVARPVDLVDVPAGVMHIGYLKGRVLPVAVAKFLDDVIQQVQKRYPEDVGL